MADSSGDKKHLATERRRRQAREEGQVVKSQDLTSAALLVLGALQHFGCSVVRLLSILPVRWPMRSPHHGLTPLETNDAANWLLVSAGRLAIAGGADAVGDVRRRHSDQCVADGPCVLHARSLSPS